MRDRWNQVSMIRPDLKHFHHEGHIIVRSNQSKTASHKMVGANGPKDSRRLIFGFRMGKMGSYLKGVLPKRC